MLAGGPTSSSLTATLAADAHSIETAPINHTPRPCRGAYLNNWAHIHRVHGERSVRRAGGLRAPSNSRPQPPLSRGLTNADPATPPRHATTRPRPLSTSLPPPPRGPPLLRVSRARSPPATAAGDASAPVQVAAPRSPTDLLCPRALCRFYGGGSNSSRRRPRRGMTAMAPTTTRRIRATRGRSRLSPPPPPPHRRRRRPGGGSKPSGRAWTAAAGWWGACARPGGCCSSFTTRCRRRSRSMSRRRSRGRSRTRPG